MFNSLRFRFCFLGFCLYILQALPNCVWFFFPPQNDALAENSSSYVWLNILEFLSGSGIVASLILLDSKCRGKRLFLYLSLLCLCAYYIAWMHYLQDSANFLVLFSIILMPILYFLSLSLYLKHPIMFVLCVPFGIFHLWIGVQNLWTL